MTAPQRQGFAPVGQPARPDPEPFDRAPPTAEDDEPIVKRSRTASTFVAVTLALAFALVMLVFVLQNDGDQAFEFLWLDFTLPVGVAMLLASIVGGLVVASFGLARVVQLRLAARRHRNVLHA